MKILLADDDAITLRLLEATIRRLGHQAVLAHHGREALDLIQSEHPDLVLLDWIMPEMEGIEVVKALKCLPLTPFVYIIILTSNDRNEDITAGLDAGANDYITKPFDQDVLKSRIAVGVRVVEYENRLERMNAELRRYSSEMEALAQERARQLVHADRMVTLGTMAAGIAHEINNPLTVVQGNIKLIRRIWTQDIAVLFQNAEQNRAYPIGSKAISDLFGSLEKSSVRMRQIIDGMRHFAQNQSEAMAVIDPAVCIQDALEICQPKLKTRIETLVEVAPAPFVVRGNAVQITQILVNFIGNAADALGGTPYAQIKIQAAGTPEQRLRFSVQDNGPGIPPETQEKLWAPFYTTKPAGIGTGLGLFICKSIMEEHGGRIGLSSSPGAGAEFYFELLNETDFNRFLDEKEKEKKSPPPECEPAG